MIEQNKLGDQVTIKEMPTLAKAQAYIKAVEKFAYEGEEYYVVDIRSEWGTPYNGEDITGW